MVMGLMLYVIIHFFILLHAVSFALYFRHSLIPLTSILEVRMFSKMLHFSCYSLNLGVSSAIIASRSPYLFTYWCISQLVAGWKRNVRIRNYSKTMIFFFLIGHLGRQVSHLYQTFHFFVWQTDKTDTFQELCDMTIYGINFFLALVNMSLRIKKNIAFLCIVVKWNFLLKFRS
jgi:hypothetical protein